MQLQSTDRTFIRPIGCNSRREGTINDDKHHRPTSMTTTNLTPASGKTVHFSKRMLIGIGALIGAPWIIVVLLMVQKQAGEPTAQNVARATTSTTEGDRTRDPMLASTRVSATSTSPSPTRSAQTVSGEVFESKRGAWGQLQLVPIVLEVPDEYVFLTNAVNQFESWTFTGKTREQAIAFAETCGLTAAQMELLQRGDWSETSAAASVKPSDELVLSLTAESRGKLYGALVLDKANSNFMDPYWYRSDEVDKQLRGSDLSPESLALFKKLLYPGREGTLLFNDICPAVRAIKDQDEQRKFVKAVSRKRSLMARLVIEADTDTVALANYWGGDGRQKDLVPILDSLKFNVLSGIESPSRLNIVTLLPPFARERLYNHAYAKQTSTKHDEDCFWTAFNFFCEYPDNEVNNMGYLGKLLERDYFRISEPTKMGDIILLVDETGQAVHAANYLADNIVYTKNGTNFTQPWILNSMDDMLETYRIKYKKIDAIYFRKR